MPAISVQKPFDSPWIKRGDRTFGGHAAQGQIPDRASRMYQSSQKIF
jgi:hypothetical protein